MNGIRVQIEKHAFRFEHLTCSIVDSRPEKVPKLKSSASNRPGRKLQVTLACMGSIVYHHEPFPFFSPIPERRKDISPGVVVIPCMFGVEENPRTGTEDG